MANRDFEMDLRMKADFASAQRALRDTQADIEKISRAAAQASDELAGVNTGGASSGGGAAQDERAAVDALNQSLGRTAASRESVNQAIRATQQAISAEIGMIGELQARLERGAASFDDLADTEARLDVAMSKGLITAEEYDEALAKLGAEQERLTRESEKTGKAVDSTVGRYDKAGAALQRLARDEQRLKEAVDSGRISRDQYNRAMAGIGAERARLTALANDATQSASAMRRLGLETAGAQRNLTQMLTYVSTGEWQLAGNQILQMGNSAGLAGRLFTGTGLAIGGMTLAVGALTAAAVSNYLQLRAIENALLVVGGTAGVTAGQVASVRNEIGEATGDYAAAQAALEGLIRSGRLTGDALESAAQAAVSLAQLTGRSIEDTTNEIIALAKSPTAAMLELNERYHFLTLEVYDNVKSLEEQGRAQEAAKVATNALASVTASRVEEMRANAGVLERAWYDVRDAVRDAWQAIKDVGREDAAARIEAGNRGIALAQGRIAALQEEVRLGIRSQAQAQLGIAAAERRIALERQNIAQWQERQDAQEATAKAAAEEQQLQDKAVAARANIDRDMARLDKRVERQQRLNRLTEEYNALAVVNPNDARLFDGSFERRKQAIIEETTQRQAKGPRGPKAADPNEAAQREVENLEKQIALLDSLQDGETRVSEAARIRYEIEEGIYRNASEAIKTRLVDNAQLLDSERAKREEAEKQRRELEETKRSYEQLQDALRTPVEAALDDAIDQVETLNKALKAGVATAGEYGQSLDRIVSGSFDKAPKFGGLSPEVGGPFSELTRLDTARDELAKWYADQLALLDQFRAKKVGTQQQWDAQELQIQAQHQAALQQLEAANAQVMLAGTAATFGQLADIAKAYGGEQSKTYRVLFALSKGFAVAQAAVALAQNVAEASKAGYPQNIGFIAGALAQGATIASLLSQANYSGGGGFAEGGYTGPGSKWQPAGVVHAEEFVARREVVRQPGARAFLEDFNDRGMAALYGWASSGFAEGGFVDALPSVPDPNWGSTGGGMQTNVNNRMRIYLLNDTDQLMERLANHPRFEKAVVAHAGANGNAIRADW